MNSLLPKYPIYIPSKNRSHACQTVKFFIKDGVNFKIVVEPSQAESYKKVFGIERLLILPEDGLKLLGSRLWIREHAIASAYQIHWQFDDNIMSFKRLHKGRRIPINSNLAISIIEDFTDRYTNIGISGFNYEFFVPDTTTKPYILNHKVFSASLINNKMPYKWRLYYNDDSDLCLQALTNGWCTIQFNAISAKKMQTMVVKGGNTQDLYKGNGRLIMARTLEEVWPKYVKTVWKFYRAQHEIDFSSFKNLKLIHRTDIDWNEIEKKTFDIKLTKVKEIKSESLKQFYEANK